MPSISRRSLYPACAGSERVTMKVFLSTFTSPAMDVRLSPSSTVTLVVEPSNVPVSGSVRYTSLTSSPSSTMPSQVRRVSSPPITPFPPSSFGRAVAFSVVSASAGDTPSMPPAKTMASATKSAFHVCANLPRIVATPRRWTRRATWTQTSRACRHSSSQRARH